MKKVVTIHFYCKTDKCTLTGIMNETVSSLEEATEKINGEIKTHLSRFERLGWVYSDRHGVKNRELTAYKNGIPVEFWRFWTTMTAYIQSVSEFDAYLED